VSITIMAHNLPLKRIHWEEDADRENRDEYYAVSRREFTISPEHIQIQRGEIWMPIHTYYHDHYWDDAP
jgi:hypothetical protein